MSATMDHGTESETQPAMAPVPASEGVHPLDEERTQAIQREPDPGARRGRGLGGNRHVGSILLSFVAVLGAYGALDYGFYRANTAASVDGFAGRMPDATLIAFGAVAGCLLLAAAAARISGLGPLLAGLVLGAAPAAWVLLDFASYLRRLDDLPEIWDHTTFGLSYVAFAVYPVVTGLMLGAAFAGRWRRPKVTD